MSLLRPYRMRRRAGAAGLRAVLLAALAAAAVACSNSATETFTGIGGHYDLETVNGAPLPFVFMDEDASGPFTQTALSARITLHNNDTYVHTLNGTFQQGQTALPITLQETGTYTRSGTLLRFITTSLTLNGIPSLAEPDTTDAEFGEGVITLVVVDTTAAEVEVVQTLVYRKR